MARGPAAAEIAELPEADRLEGFAHPRETRQLYGHRAAEAALAEALGSGRMHHAWLLTGPEGIGKATLAYRFARAALARADERDMFAQGLDAPLETPTSRQILGLAHPGLIVIRRGYDQKAKRFISNISVDEVRRLRSFLSLSAEEGGWRVVIVDSADDMNINAANALLKSLEEPPPRTVFLIVCAAPGRLLPTIRSRCRVLAMEPLAHAELALAAGAALAVQGKATPGEADAARLEALSGGSVRRFLALMGAGGLQMQGRIESILSSLPALDLKGVHQLAEELQPAAAEQKYELFFELLLETLARLVRASATGLGRADDLKLSGRLIAPNRVAAFAQLWETLSRDKADADALNLDRKALILDAFAKIEVAARP